ncbi:MAG: hypothetical protein FJ320_03280 [SAR202 cluster bacterium]|nr:hypothetical protein [SAR202 cluster bacterium]
MAPQQPLLTQEQREGVLLALLKHLEERSPFMDAFVDRIVDQHPDAVTIERQEDSLDPVVKVRMSKIVSLAIGEFILDAFGKNYVLYVTTDSMEDWS